MPKYEFVYKQHHFVYSIQEYTSGRFIAYLVKKHPWIAGTVGGGSSIKQTIEDVERFLKYFVDNMKI